MKNDTILIVPEGNQNIQIGSHVLAQSGSDVL